MGFIQIYSSMVYIYAANDPETLNPKYETLNPKPNPKVLSGGLLESLEGLELIAGVASQPRRCRTRRRTLNPSQP